ncbi:MAG: helix-turn-helix domain-containing protein [Desulfovibrionaceae bacterium]|nr:helix-turn-helix domain-containing protein [Desulfovibrionaceae bacterium]
MSQLQSLEQIESVVNLNHRAVLKALRDTAYSIAEIAARLGIHRTSVYYIAKAYLPTGYLNKRKQMLQLEKMSKAPEDIVNVVPDINTKRSNSVQNQTAISEPLTVEQPQTSLNKSNNFDRSQKFPRKGKLKLNLFKLNKKRRLQF